MPTASVRIGLTLLLGLGGAVVAVAIGVPLPWMLGPMILVTLAALAGAPLQPPIALRKVMVPVIGVLLGSGFHPSLLEAPSTWLVPLAFLPVFIALAFAAAYAVFRYMAGFDRVTAYFAAAPGGLNDMMILGGEAGGSERRIALAHATRILVVVSAVSLFYGLFLSVQTSDAGPTYVAFAAIPLPDLAILGACAVLGAWAAPRLHLPAPQILGPMILSAIVHLTGLTDAPPPTLIVNAAQLVMGSVVGCRFLGV
ncbi:MAG: AbrB family transcriptional regulator, partial [Pseudomonadota bacterium]